MLTAEQAYRRTRVKHPLSRIRSCLEFKNFYAFSLAPFYIKDSENYTSGPFMTAVDKKTGRVYEYNILDGDPNEYLAAKKIDVKTIFEQKV